MSLCDNSIIGETRSLTMRIRQVLQLQMQSRHLCWETDYKSLAWHGVLVDSHERELLDSVRGLPWEQLALPVSRMRSRRELVAYPANQRASERISADAEDKRIRVAEATAAMEEGA
eukprot:4477776-Amphidinium_carterae.2